jgi:hypothetical protein
MTKTRYFRIGGKSIDSNELGRILTQEAKDAQEAQMDTQVEQIVVELNNLLVELNAKTSNRGRGFYAVRYNAPFEDSEIHVRKRRDSNGDLSYTIRVNNDKFNILDQGSPARTSKKMMRFPRYRGNLTSPDSLDIAAAPVEIVDVRTVKTATQTAFDDFDKIFGGKSQQIEGWVSAHDVAEIKPRNFILKIADKVRRNFGGQRGVRAGLVKVTVRKN